MREIKFRGKDIETGKWWYGNLTVGKSSHIGNWAFGSYWHAKVDSDTVGQYTGLKDKNGSEIYEGDIVKHKGFAIYTIEFECLKSWYYMRDKYDDEDSLYLDHKNIEIIGNIYDNSELLSK